jgi:hypothetical protein
MAYKTRRILQEENGVMREILEDARDMIDGALGFDEDEDEEIEDPDTSGEVDNSIDED